MATPVFVDVHGFEEAGVPEPVSCVVELIQVFNVPLIVGLALIIIISVVPVAHVGTAVDVGVKVYVCEPTVEVEIVAGFHVPAILLFDVVGKVPGVPF